jgi:D-hexose-6-phosphate mutarotase
MATGWQMGVRNGLETVEIATAASTCSIALHGAQVLSFAPRGQRDWLWVSDKARFAVGTALRGGIPICFPWFGAHPSERAFPAHGFARTRPWRLAGVAEVAAGRVRAELALSGSGDTAPLFPHPFDARLAITAGDDLELAFEVANPGSAPFAFEVALHTYFDVSDAGAAAVEGLAGCAYVDKVASGARRTEGAGPVRFEGEVDRVYDAGGPLTLVDLARAPLTIDASGAASTIVWNPGAAKTATFSDVSPGGFHGFVCVESGNVGEHRVQVEPGARHRLSVRYRRGGA